MKNNNANQVGNPHEQKLKQKIKSERMQAIKEKAREDFEDKPVSESLYTSYLIANLSSYLLDFFSIVTGTFAFFYLLHNQFGSAPLVLAYSISLFFGIAAAILIQYGKREALGRFFPSYYKYSIVKWSAFLLYFPLLSFSIGLTFYCCTVFPSFMSEVEGLEDLAVLEQNYNSELDSLSSRIAIVTSGLIYKTGGKKGEVKTGASKLLRELEDSKKSLLAEKKMAIDEARERNTTTTKIHYSTQEEHGYLLGYISIFLELIALTFCLGFVYYYEYLVNNEDDTSIHQNLTPDQLFNAWIREGLPKNDTPNNFFFRTDKINNTETPVITDKKQAFKLVVQHQKDDGEIVEMDYKKVAVRVREYAHRVSQKIAQIQKDGYNNNKGKELSNRFHKLDYWVRKQHELISLYDENLERV